MEDFATEFGLNKLIRYNTEVLFVGLESDGRWKVKSKTTDKDKLSEETYDTIVVCTGNFTEPKMANIPGN